MLSNGQDSSSRRPGMRASGRKLNVAPQANRCHLFTQHSSGEAWFKLPTPISLLKCPRTALKSLPAPCSLCPRHTSATIHFHPILFRAPPAGAVTSAIAQLPSRIFLHFCSVPPINSLRLCLMGGCARMVKLPRERGCRPSFPPELSRYTQHPLYATKNSA